MSANDIPPANEKAIPANASNIPSHCKGRKRSLGNSQLIPSAVKMGAV